MRVRGVSLVIAVVMVLLGAGCDWSQFRFGANHTGSNADNGISVSTVGTLALDWSATTSQPVRVSPAVAGGVVYIGTDGEFLHAYDAAGVRNCSDPPKTCSDIWTGIGAFGAGSSSAGAAGNLVYLGSDVGDLYAFDRGCQVQCDYTWVSTLNGPVTAAPAITGGVVYITSNAESAKLYAFDAAGDPSLCSAGLQICRPLWTAAVAGNDATSPAVADGVVYVAGEEIYAFDRDRHHELFRVAEVVRAAVDRDDRKHRVVVADGGRRHAVRRRGGRQALCVRRGWADELREHDEDVRAAVDGGDRRRDAIVTGLRGRRGVRRFGRRQALCVRRSWADELLERDEDVRAVVDGGDGRPRAFVARARQRRAVRGLRRRQALRVRSARTGQLQRVGADVHSAVVGDDRWRGALLAGNRRRIRVRRFR